jgi:hypothetical protein
LAPWSVRSSSWPGCGERSQVSMTSRFGTGSVFTQYNSGSPLTFANEVSVAGAPTVCYGVAPVVLYEGTTSNPQASGVGTSAKKVCLTPAY